MMKKSEKNYIFINNHTLKSVCITIFAINTNMRLLIDDTKFYIIRSSNLYQARLISL